MESSAPEKSILIQGMTRVNCEYAETWFLIKRTRNGALKATEVFKDAPKDQLHGEEFFWQSSCVQVDSFVYVLGGRSTNLETSRVLSDRVRRIDIKNPRDGWKPCKPLPFPAGYASYCAAGTLVYLFPEIIFTLDTPNGFIYDISGHMNTPMASPPASKPRLPSQSWDVRGCVAYDFGIGNRGVLTQIEDQYSRLEKYDPDNNSWKPLDNSQLPDPLPGLPSLRAFLNGILYVSYCDWNYLGYATTVLHAYDIRTGTSLLGNGKGIILPKFEKLEDVQFVKEEISLVAVADFKLCYLWFDSTYQYNAVNVVIATVVFSDDRLSATIFEEELVMNVGEIQNIIPVDSFDVDETKKRQRDALCLQKEEMLEGSTSEA